MAILHERQSISNLESVASEPAHRSGATNDQGGCR
jgi:hypothetical protein